MTMHNPLLDMQDLPPFCALRPEHMEPAIDAVLDDNRTRLETLLAANEPGTWDSLMQPLEEMDNRLNRIWSPISHMNAVVNSKDLRAAYNACLPKLSDYATELSHNTRLYQAIRAIADGPEYAHLDPAQRKIIDNDLRDFHLGGVDLPKDKKARFKTIQQTLSTLTSKFEENLLDATHAWTRHITREAELDGLPDSARAMARQAAEERELDGWVLTLDFPAYYAVLTHAEDRALREMLYRAYTTRASDQGGHCEWDNTDIMAQLLALRHEAAQLLGFANFAERSLATKMAHDPQQVLDFLNDLARRSRPMAERELAELRAFACEHHAHGDLQAWDIAYYSEKLRCHLFDISQETLKPYFPAPQVIHGMFEVVRRLYGLDIQEVEGTDTWHPDVRFYAIRDSEGALRGRFYLDLYARAKKRGGAWMDECISRLRHADASLQRPVAYLTCNFTPPVGEQPALLTHDEVTTLFHEFGHGLHHMLTRIDHLGVSGISGVPWDAVELPSQFMENWCWEREALDLIAAHHQTGTTLPKALYDKMIAARNFQSGMQMLRQMELSLFDFHLHLDYDPDRGARIQEILNTVRQDIAVVVPPTWNRFQHSFSHIFAGGYAAGYYSYKWAEVLSADAFGEFEEKGIFDRDTGRAFLHHILEQGGASEPMALFVAFRGREPSIDALLRHSGIAA